MYDQISILYHQISKASELKFDSLSILLLLFFLGCSGDDVEGVSFLEEYDIPFQEKTFARKYTYVVYPDLDTIVHYITLRKIGDSFAGTRTIFYDHQPVVEIHYSIRNNRKIIDEEFYYDRPGETAAEFARVKAERIEFREVNSDKEIKDVVYETVFTNAIGFKTIMEERNRFEKDTVLTWNGDVVNTLKFNYRSSVMKQIKYLPFFTRTWDQEEGAFFYGQHIGLMATRYYRDGELFEMRLVSIALDSVPFALPDVKLFHP